MSLFTVTIPRLRTGNLLLREYRQEDFAAFAAFYQTERSRFIGGPLTAKMAWRGLATHLGHWALRGYGFRAVEARRTGRFCGHVGLWYPEGWLEPEVGWVMMDHAEGRGVAHEAALAAEGRRFIGREAVQASYAGIFETFPEAAWTADRHHVTGDTGLSEWRFVGTDRTGKKVDVQGCDIFRFDGDLIALKDSYRKSKG